MEPQEEYKEAVKQYEVKTGKTTTRSTILTEGEFDWSFALTIINRSVINRSVLILLSFLKRKVSDKMMPYSKWLFYKNITAAGFPCIISDVQGKDIYDKM